MRGRIIHYNANDGRGLVAGDDQQQYPFEIVQWRSSMAPAMNQVVQLDLADGKVSAVTRVSDEELLKEKASALAARLGSAGGAALQGIKRGSAGVSSPAGGWVGLLGKPVLIAQALFAVGALFLTYVSFTSPFGVGGRAFSLVSLSGLSEQLGASVGGSFLPWLAILSVGLPLFWKSRWAWLALLLPLLATVKPFVDIALAANKAASAMGGGFGGQIADQIMDMIGMGAGAWVCLLSSLFLAAIALKRTLLPPVA